MLRREKELVERVVGSGYTERRDDDLRYELKEAQKDQLVNEHAPQQVGDV